MGYVWSEAARDAESRPPDWLTAGFAALLAIGVVVAALSHSWLYDSLRARLGKNLDPGFLDLIQPSLLYSGIIVAAIGFLGRRIATRLRGIALAVTTFVLAASVFPMLIVRWYAPLRIFAENHSSRRLAQAILASPERDLPIYGYYYFRTSLPFYLQRPVGLLSIEWGELTSNYQVAHQAAERRAANGQPGMGVLLTPAEFIAVAKSNAHPVLVLTPNALVESLWSAAGRIDPLWNGANYSVWEIPPAGASRPESTPTHVVAPFQP
jgi:hypothetical protein